MYGIVNNSHMEAAEELVKLLLHFGWQAHIVGERDTRYAAVAAYPGVELVAAERTRSLPSIAVFVAGQHSAGRAVQALAGPEIEQVKKHAERILLAIPEDARGEAALARNMLAPPDCEVLLYSPVTDPHTTGLRWVALMQLQEL